MGKCASLKKSNLWVGNSTMEVLRFKCRRSSCNKPAIEGQACCSLKCRSVVPSCTEPKCTNATEPCIVKGSGCYYSLKCYVHGGGIIWDKEFSGYKRAKTTYVLVEGQLIEKFHGMALEPTDKIPTDIGVQFQIESV